MQNKTFKDEVKARSDILEVARELVPNLKRSGAIWIGSIRNEGTPALTIYPDTQSYYHFAGDTNPAGQQGGDVFSLVQYVKNCDFKEALKFLAEKAGMEYRPLSPEDIHAANEDRRKFKSKTQALEKLVTLFSRNQEKAVEYLYSRGINQETAKGYRIGWANHSTETLRNELAEFDNETVSEILRNPAFFSDSLIIPIIEHGTITSLYSRSDTRTAKHMFLPGFHKGIFNYDTALKSADSRLYLAEAPIDALSAISKGIKNIVGFGGCQLSNEQKELLARLNKRSIEIVSCFDNDAHAPTNQGHMATKTLLAAIPNAMTKVLPPGDLNDFFLVKTKSEFDSLPEKSLFELLLEELPPNTPPDKLPLALNYLFEALAQHLDPAFPELFIRNNLKTYFDITARDTETLIKSYKTLKVKSCQEKAEAEARQKQAEVVEEKKLTDEEKRKAEEILHSPTLLYDALQAVKRLGIVGEETNVLTFYCVVTSRLLNHPLSVVVKGQSSAGKSYTSRTTLLLFPKAAYIDLTDATPQSFYYVADDYFKHKIIVIFERHGSEKADYAIRSLQSEGKLKIQVTVKNPETGQFETVNVEKEGPTGFITTTTSASIHSENETRNISIYPDETPEQTSRVYEAVEAPYLGITKPDESEMEPWRNAQLLLEKLPVNIPYVSGLNKHFPQNILRTRRDYGHFLAHIEAVAFLHQKQRGRIEIGGKTYIRATLADYYIANIIAGESLSKSIYELPPKTIQLIQVAGEITKAKQEGPRSDLGFGGNDDAPTFTITDLAKKIGWDRDTVSNWTKPAIRKGYFSIVNESRGRKGAEYKVETKDLPGESFLPTVEELLAENPNESTDGIYNPLTGEKVNIGSYTDAPIEK